MIYVASSWRNAFQPTVVDFLRAEGFLVYDFRHPDEQVCGFHWSDIDPDWESWTTEEYRKVLCHPLAEHGFWLDRRGLDRSTSCVLVMPCGRSAHLELGYMLGQCKPGFVYIPPTIEVEPELMNKLATGVSSDIAEIAHELKLLGAK